MEKKKGFWEKFFKIKTDTKLDEILLKKDVEKKFKSRITKKFFILLGLGLIVFFILVIVQSISIMKNENIEVAEKKNRQVVEIKTDNFGIWQSQFEQKFKDEKKERIADGKRIESKIDATNDFLTKDLPETLKKIVSGINNKFKDFASDFKEETKSLGNKIDNLAKDTDRKIDNLEDKINKEIEIKFVDVNSKIQDLSNKPIVAQGILPEVSNKDTALPKPVDIPKEEEEVIYQANIKVSQPDPVEEEVQERKELTFNAPLGVAQAILLNGGDASVANMGNQEDSPVALSLLTKMSIANGEYTNVEDCLLLGNAIGNMNTERANIRLTKISCIFKDKQGNKYRAEGAIKGWIYDETSNLGVGGKLITKEGKIIRATLPLAAAQTGLDYITRKASNVSLVGGGYSDLTAALGSGGSSAATQTISKMTDIYTKYLDAMTPSINFKGGRKVSILFQGGESIPLVPYDDKNNFDGEGVFNSIQGEKYNYQGNEADYD
ncbi:hypothetical protein BKH42_03610 [Helicobacter sp. 13S00482-2]|uniref:TraB/VirB10 family protein n=1 Tax=Helicobacter sp. 13S00482-2 TaxID=1476200 RepID=UPI000BA5FD5D|nr:TraB/VirB10 family protein [Helicobacter sp. 13S00482-2]PAF53828.1 hypothetical protein BKH42_03610 [Helicobacter sp. 13S00482-2]